MTRDFLVVFAHYDQFVAGLINTLWLTGATDGLAGPPRARPGRIQYERLIYGSRLILRLRNWKVSPSVRANRPKRAFFTGCTVNWANCLSLT